MTKTLYNFGLSKCNRANTDQFLNTGQLTLQMLIWYMIFWPLRQVLFNGGGLYKIQESLLRIFGPHRSTYRHGISVTNIN